MNKMLNSSFTQGGWFIPVKPVAGRTNSNAGAHADRHSLFEARSARRRGDWSILEVPTAVLWLDNPCVPTPDPDGCPEDVIIELWP